MQQNKKEQNLYERILKEHVSAVILKRWPYNYHCGLWNKHKPDETGRQYIIQLNKTRSVDCGKVTLIHELIHICDDLGGVERSNGATEDKTLVFYENNKRFVNYLWEKYIKI